MTPKSAFKQVVLLKGNGPISINNEMMELLTITLAHGCVGLPLKSLHADKVYIVKERDKFWEIHKQIKEKPCCFIHFIDGFDEENLINIKAQHVSFV